MTCADTQEGVLHRNQWYPIPNGSYVFLLQSLCIITAVKGEPLTLPPSLEPVTQQ